jgi:hypothetical protein
MIIGIEIAPGISIFYGLIRPAAAGKKWPGRSGANFSKRNGFACARKKSWLLRK